jgi:hypothetical protein
VTYQRGFPVIVEFSVGHGDPFAGMGDVKETVVKIFVVGLVRG